MISPENVRTGQEKLLKSLYWDYNIDPTELLAILHGSKSLGNVFFTRERIFLRMLERLNWMDIISLLTKEQIRELLTPAVIAKIRFEELRERYEFLRKVVSGETVSFTGWGDAYYQKIKHTFLSNRWYRSQPTLL